VESKVAIATKDGKHIIGAFGSIKYFKVYEIKNGEVVGEETRTLYQDDAGSALPDISRKQDGFGGMPFNLGVFDAGKEKHMKMAKAISDCDTVIARKMCANARDSILQFNMKPYETSFSKFDKAIESFIAGTLEDEKST
jgi:predicted Fe-Mo cluster-binding NifX family protein